MREADAARRAVEVGDVALEAQRPRLALAGAERLARRLHLKPDQGRGGGIVEPGHAIGPADMDKVARDRRGGAHLLDRGIDPRQRTHPARDRLLAGVDGADARGAAPPPPQDQVGTERAAGVGRPAAHGRGNQAGIDRHAGADEIAHVLDDEIERARVTHGHPRPR